MQKAIISVVYHNQFGHTAKVAGVLAENLQSLHSEVYLLSVQEAEEKMDVLHASDTIVFGCPTYFGNVSAAFKQFMEQTGSFWYRQLWKNKLAAGFTVSSTSGADKSNTLTSLALFAAQHSMHWIGLGVLPRFCNDVQTEGQNRLASYLGLMVQTDNSQLRVSELHAGDMLTTELFARRILEVSLHFKHIHMNHDDIIKH